MKKETKIESIWIHPDHLHQLMACSEMLLAIVSTLDPKEDKYPDLKRFIEKALLPF